MTLAASRLQQGAVDEAIQIARDITDRWPEASEGWHIWALGQAAKGDAAGAEPLFRQAMRCAPRNPHVLANLATALRRLGRQEEAITLWEQALHLSPEFGQAWLDLGLGRLDAGAVEAACTSLQHATRLLPNSANAWLGLGCALHAARRLPEAASALRKTVSLAPLSAIGWGHLGAVLRELGHAAEALTCCVEAERLGGASPELLDARAGILLDLGRVAEATATARELSARHPRFLQGQVTLARVLWEYEGARREGETPLSAMEHAVRTYPHDRSLRLAYAQLLSKTGQPEAALSHLAMLRREEDHPVLQRIHADTLELLDRCDESAPIYERLCRADDAGDPSLLHAHARHLLKTGRWQAAAEVAERAIARDPGDQEAWAYLGIAWRLLGDAREDWLCDYDRLVTCVEVDLPRNYADMEAFLASLEASLMPMHQATHEPMEQSLRGGSQTPGNLFGRTEPPIVAAASAMQATANRWVQELEHATDHPFLQHVGRSVRLAGAWSVKLQANGRHANHIHQFGWISSAFYVSLPPAITESSRLGTWQGCIQFGQPPEELQLGLPPRRVIRPLPGHVVLFPSYLWHGTTPFEGPDARLTIASDMVPGCD